MKRKRVLLSNRAVVAFVLVLTVGGFALAASGHFDNPVVALRDTVAMNDLLSGADSLALPPQSAASSQSITLTALDSTTSDSALPPLSASSSTDSSTSTFTLPALSADASANSSADTSLTLPALDTLAADTTGADASLTAAADADNSGIRWSEIGDVFFDLWFLAAVTAFVIVFQRVAGFVRTRLPQPSTLGLAR